MAIFYWRLVVSFIRKEALGSIKFYWEGVLGIILVLLGTRLIFSIFWISNLLGCLLIVLGLVILVTFLKKYITSIKQESLGCLSVTERQVFYSHPTRGGLISLDALSAISLVTEVEGPSDFVRLWRLEDDDGSHLSFPINVLGVDKFIDSLIFLPKVNYGSLRVAMVSKENKSILVWKKL